MYHHLLSLTLTRSISMTIYTSKRNHREYRKIYEDHYGKIPIDELGRSYDIHHKDGDRSNNDPSNLVALSRKQHYQVHYDQGDYFAAWLIAKDIDKTGEELGELSRQHAKKLVESGKHNLLKRPDGTSVASDRVKDGTHHLLSGDIQRRVNMERLANGTHQCLKKGKEAPRYDHRVFYFAHNDGTKFTGTQYDFRKLYPNVLAGHMSRLISGDLKSTKGWKLFIL
jgi:hypothetical protein